MRKILSIVAFSIMSLSLTFAQKGKVNTAEFNLSSGEVAKAKETIGEALNDAEMQIWPKAWLVKGNIYKAIFEQREINSELYNTTPNTLDISKDAYFKAFEVETNPKKKKDVKVGLDAVGTYYYNEGIAAFTNSNWEVAYNNFINTQEISDFLTKNQMSEKIDTQAYFVVMLSAFNYQKYDDAILAGEKLKSLGDKREVVYTVLIDSYKQKGEKVKYENTIAEGRKLYPNNIDILFKEINLYLEKNQIDVLEEKLNEAIKLDPKNPSLYQALANVYDKKGKTDEAFQMYDKAIQVKPDYFEAYYNKAILYFNKAMEIVEKMNDENDNKKYEVLKTQREALLKEKTLPLLEKAYQLAPKDENVIKALKEVYARLEMFDEMKKLSK
jgi:tetratricopeptide (TPR) repeat protein